MDHQFAQDAKEQVRQATDIVELAGSYLQLRRQGRLYVAHCPWHDDSRPSLQINPDRHSWKCWVCDIGGDVFNFVMRIERVEFREALEMLAERAGIALTRAAGPKPEPGSPGDKRTQLAAMAWAAQEFQQCLSQTAEGERARRYLEGRGIDGRMRERFQIGFSPPEWEWLLRRSHDSPYSPAVLERVGLLGQRASGDGYYDRFRGRVIFPICDVRGRPIAFGGRVLPELADERAAKYVNSPETPLYSKSDHLYALDLARDAVAQVGHVVVMEGYTDVIMAHQHGVTNAVACCGTALGERHLRLLRRFTEQVVLVLDGDEAGQRRTSEILELFVAHQVDLRILTLPAGLDPCDYLLEHGGEGWASLVATAADALEHKFRLIDARIGRAPGTHETAQAVEELLATLAKVNVRVGQAGSAALVREQQMLGRMARKFHLREDDLRHRLKALRRSGKQLTRPRDVSGEAASAAGDPAGEPASPEPKPAMLSRWEQEIFELVLSNPALVGPIVESIPDTAMENDAGRWLYGTCKELHVRQQAVTFDRLMAAATNDRQANLLVDLEEAAQLKHASDHDQRLQDAIAHYHRQHGRADRHRRLADLREGQLDTQQEEELLSQFFDNLKRRQTGPLSTDG